MNTGDGCSMKMVWDALVHRVFWNKFVGNSSRGRNKGIIGVGGAIGTKTNIRTQGPCKYMSVFGGSMVYMDVPLYKVKFFICRFKKILGHGANRLSVGFLKHVGHTVVDCFNPYVGNGGRVVDSI